jgi:hypothetical protein
MMHVGSFAGCRAYETVVFAQHDMLLHIFMHLLISSTSDVPSMLPGHTRHLGFLQTPQVSDCMVVHVNSSCWLVLLIDAVANGHFICWDVANAGRALGC